MTPDNHHQDWHHQDWNTLNRQRLLGFLIVVAASVAVASFYPKGLVLPAFSTILSMAALVASLVAALTREPINPDYLTRWDEAAVLYAAGLVSGFWIDPTKVEHILKLLQHASGAG